MVEREGLGKGWGGVGEGVGAGLRRGWGKAGEGWDFYQQCAY